MNTIPEWFTVEPDRHYVVTDWGSGTAKTLPGKQLREGLDVQAEPDSPVQITVRPE